MVERNWHVEVYDGGNFASFYKRLDEAERAVTDAAIQHVLAPIGIDICASEWGKISKMVYTSCGLGAISRLSSGNTGQAMRWNQCRDGGEINGS